VQPPEQDGTLPDYSQDGIDLSLIRWFLSLTPAERLQALQEHVDDLTEVLERNAAR
jgi:hypothetical protein